MRRQYLPPFLTNDSHQPSFLPTPTTTDTPSFFHLSMMTLSLHPITLILRSFTPYPPQKPLHRSPHPGLAAIQASKDNISSSSGNANLAMIITPLGFSLCLSLSATLTSSCPSLW